MPLTNYRDVERPIESESDLLDWANRTLDRREVEVEELDPEYHDGEQAFDITIPHGMNGDELTAIVARFEVEELYVSTETKRFACDCCGNITTGKAEFTVIP